VTMLADSVELVIGIDTHKASHTAAVVDRLGGVAETFEFTADPGGLPQGPGPGGSPRRDPNLGCRGHRQLWGRAHRVSR
jgi:hypothetical protein